MSSPEFALKRTPLTNASEALRHFPGVRDDTTLGRSNSVLAQVIVWQNSPFGDAFMAAHAEPMIKGADFQRVALASIRYGSSRYFRHEPAWLRRRHAVGKALAAAKWVRNGAKRRSP